jgi:hypothetical protein
MSILLDEMVHGRLSAGNLVVDIDISSLTSNSLVADSDVEELGSFQFNTPDFRTVNINVPCIDESLVLAGSDNLDQADSDVSAFVAAIENGIAVTGGTIIPSDVDGQTGLEMYATREIFRASGKRR